jgi:hypothetical protein
VIEMSTNIEDDDYDEMLDEGCYECDNDDCPRNPNYKNDP